MRRLLFPALLCLLALSCTRDLKQNDEQFVSGNWIKADVRERGRMTTDLLSSRVLEGKLRAEVREILGEPDNITKAGNFEYKTDPGAWLHGANNGPWIHYLHVDFGGEQSRVERAYITD